MNVVAKSEEKGSRLGSIIQTRRFFHEILAPTDFSSRSDRALDYAVHLARRLGAHLTLLHVVPAPFALDYTLGGIPSEQWERHRHEVDKKLEAELKLAKFYYGHVDTLVRTGSDLHNEIVGAVREVSADIVVLSTHHYEGWKRLLFGSDADELLIKIPCPLIVVR
jgi:nucleotide-binding universal stress UspA family protein